MTDELLEAVRRTEAFCATCSSPPTREEQEAIDRLLIEELLAAGAEAEA